MANHHGVIVTHLDKASKFLVADLGKNKTSSEVNRVTIEFFTEIPEAQLKTMTFDNGKEFSGHAELSEKLGLLCYFANPHHSWERGLNEHTNGLLRQFFPKQTNFKIVKPEALEKVVILINKRPRKSPDYKTPFEVFYSDKSDQYLGQFLIDYDRMTDIPQVDLHSQYFMKKKSLKLLS